jgi:hypothetical protein
VQKVKAIVHSYSIFVAEPGLEPNTLDLEPVSFGILDEACGQEWHQEEESGPEGQPVK